jgi:hypothetical protein
MLQVRQVCLDYLGEPFFVQSESLLAQSERRKKSHEKCPALGEQTWSQMSAT